MSGTNRESSTASARGSGKCLRTELGTSSVSRQSDDANLSHRQDRTHSLQLPTNRIEIRSIKTKGAKGSGLADTVVTRLDDQTPTELHIRTVIQALHEQGIRVSDIRCICCHARLVDIAHIRMTPQGPICPECIERSTTGDNLLPNEAKSCDCRGASFLE